MHKKILLGMAAVAIACMIAGAGYRFGKALAHTGPQQGVETPVAG